MHGHSARHVPWREAYIDHPARVGIRQQRHGTHSRQQRARCVASTPFKKKRKLTKGYSVRDGACQHHRRQEGRALDMQKAVS